MGRLVRKEAADPRRGCALRPAECGVECGRMALATNPHLSARSAADGLSAMGEPCERHTAGCWGASGCLRACPVSGKAVWVSAVLS